MSLPCHHSEAGYRTFDAAFAVDDGEGDTMGLVKMVYQHSALRDGREAGSEYGAAGFCRKGVYGMPRDWVNTMRVCTRDSKGAVYDASVPVRPRYGPGLALNASYQEELRCADSPYEVPWFAEGDGDAERGSAGTVPLWDGVYSGAPKYPSDAAVREGRVESLRAGVVPGSQQSGCHVGELLRCEASTDCVGTGAAALECVRGVCVLDRAATSTCYSHADCAAEGKLCTGDGYCMDPLYQVENWRDEPIEFQSYASECQGVPRAGQELPEAYDMYGASPWERVPDILQLHGQCGYRRWFEYQQFVNATGAVGAFASNFGSLCRNASSGSCRSVDYQSDSAYWWDTAQPDESVGFPTLWRSGRFRVQPHACDRDYMHVQGMRGCAPVTTVSPLARTGFVLLDPSLKAPKSAPLQNPRGRIMQTFNQGRYVPVIRADPPPGWAAEEWATGGFLYKRDLDGDQSGTPFVPCSSVKQCKKDGYQVAGRVVQRMTRAEVGKEAQAWEQVWAGKCGMFGARSEGGECRLDLVSLPLYRALCHQRDASGRLVPYGNATSFEATQAACRKVKDYSSVCAAIRDNYASAPSANALETVRRSLNQLADELGGATSTAEGYLNKVACSDALYEAIQQDPLGHAGLHGQDRVWSFHYFFGHTTVEVPLALWHKCVLMSGRKLSAGGGLATATVRCEAWSDPVKRDSIQEADYTQAPLATLLRSDGVISRTQSALVRTVLGQMVSATVNEYVQQLDGLETMFGHKGMRRETAMACHSSAAFKPRAETGVSMPEKCWADLVRWAQRGGRPRDLSPYNGYDAVPEGVSPDCYEFQGPYAGTSRELDVEYGMYLGTVNGQGYGPKPFSVIQKLLTSSEVSAKYVRPVDFVNQIVERSSTGNGHGLVMWEFAPPDLPRVQSPSKGGLADAVDGCKKTNNAAFRRSMAKRIPCVTPKEVKDRFPCHEGEAKFDPPMTELMCDVRHAAIWDQVEQRQAEAQKNQVLINGELRKGTYVAPQEIPAAEIGLAVAFAVLMPGIGTVVGAGLGAAAGVKASQARPVLRVEEVSCPPSVQGRGLSILFLLR